MKIRKAKAVKIILETAGHFFAIRSVLIDTRIIEAKPIRSVIRFLKKFLKCN